MYVDAFNRLRQYDTNGVTLVNFTDIKNYYDSFTLPYSFEFLIDAMRMMEITRNTVKPFKQ